MYIGDIWETFLAQRDRMPNWKIPLSIAAVLHLVVFTGAAIFPDVGKKFVPDNVITVDLLSLPSAELAPVAGGQVAPRRGKQESSSQQPPPVEKVARNTAQEKVGQTTELPAPEVEEIAEVAEAAEPTLALPVVTPRKISKVVLKNVQKPVPPPPESVAQAKPVSLHPVKRKKKLADDIRLAEMKAREEREKQQAQEALQQEQEQRAASEKKRLAEQQKREKVAEQERKLAEQRKREKAAKQERKLAEQRKREKAAKQKRKLAAQKKRQQEADAKKRLAEQQRREIAEAARLARQAEEAAEQAHLEAARARSEYASVAQAVSDLNSPLVTGDSGFSSGGYSEGYSEESGRASRGYGGYGREQRVNPAVLKQYAASLNGRISSHWQLPETVKTQSNLRTMVALTLRRDGSIEDMRIERKSGDSFFDQSVIKALRSSAPLPGFPALIKQSTLEFALNFTPQGLAL
ncbi:TolA protein [Candidatus Electrothrix laxa]